jgi:acetyl-CoA carboxylase biotin carboxyl carrier protein
MPTYRLVATVDTESGDAFLVRSPAVGFADGLPGQGVYLNPSEGFLTLTVLNRRYTVELPRNVQGLVTEQLIEDTWTPVAYGQPLFRLSQAEAVMGSRAGKDQAVGGEAKDADDLIAVPAPSDGVFYRRPSPEVPAYVDEGSEVSTGSVLGLVEVMKSFNQIAYGGPGLPERGTVVRILAEDAAEVAYGQTLFLVKPA